MGFFAVALAGLFNGSFPAPSKGINAWKWEHIWLVYSFWAMALLPVGLAWAFSHGAIARLLVSEPGLSLKLVGFGALWGLGSLLFGVSLTRLGMAITNAMINGIVVFLGSLGPVLIGAVHLSMKHLMGLLGGEGLLAVSLVLCAAASISRDRAQGKSSSRSVSRAQSVGALLLTVAAGVLSSMLNIGFVFGASLADKAKVSGCPALLTTVAIWMPTLLGGLIFNMGYPAYLVSRSKSWACLFSGRGNMGCWLRSSLMGVLWFGAILLYGIGASSMGSAGTVYGWALIVAFSILTSNAWGALTGEWKNSGSKPKALMWLSTALLTGSLVVLAGQRVSSQLASCHFHPRLSRDMLPYASPKEGWWSKACSQWAGEAAAICELQFKSPPANRDITSPAMNPPWRTTYAQKSCVANTCSLRGRTGCGKRTEPHAAIPIPFHARRISAGPACLCGTGRGFTGQEQTERESAPAAGQARKRV